MKPSLFGMTLIFTCSVLIGLAMFNGVYLESSGPIESAASVHQLNGGSVEYAVGRSVGNGILPHLVYGISLFAVCIAWGVTILSTLKSKGLPK